MGGHKGARQRGHDRFPLIGREGADIPKLQTDFPHVNPWDRLATQT
jgi:hypothetical protein